MLNLRSSMCLEEFVDTEASFASTADGFEEFVPFTSASLLGPPTSAPRPEQQPQQAIAEQESLAMPPHRRSNSPDNEPWMRMRTPSPENTYSGYTTGRALPGPPGTLLPCAPAFVQQPQYMPVLCYVCPTNMAASGQADAKTGMGSKGMPSVSSWSTMASEDDRGFEVEDTQCLPCETSEVPESNFILESKGSIGHPYSCASACKYIKKVRGCKDGADCDRCHLCAFRNKSKKPGMAGGAQQRAIAGW